MREPASPIRFGTSGWRAVLAEEFTFANARRVVTAIARVLAEDGRAGDLVLVGYDTRFLADRGRRVIAWDAARGAPLSPLDFRFGTSAGSLDAFLESAGARLSRLNAKRDPLFGGESPQCGEKELVALAREVTIRRSRLGLACDGDSDRFGVCDERGAYVAPNRILALVFRDLVGRKGRRGGGARSVAATHALDALAARFGGPCYE